MTLKLNNIFDELARKYYFPDKYSQPRFQNTCSK